MIDVVEALKSQADAMMRLAEQYNKGDDPLTKEDHELIRMAILPILSEKLDMIKYDFLAGGGMFRSWLNDIHSIVDY